MIVWHVGGGDECVGPITQVCNLLLAGLWHFRDDERLLKAGA